MALTESIRWLYCRVQALPPDSALMRMLAEESERPQWVSDPNEIASMLSMN